MKTTTPIIPDDINSRQNDPVQHVRTNGTGSLYGSRALAEEILAICKQPIRVPEIDKKYIQAIASSRGHDGEYDVREYSARHFGRENAEFEGQLRRLGAVIGIEVAGAERHCKEFSARLEQTPPTIIHHRDGQPWTRFSRILVASLILLSLGGLAMGINTNALVLMSTGIPAFETPWRAYCYSMVPILLAGIVKIVGSLLESPSRRLNYTFAVCISGIILGVLWAASFANTFPGFTQSAADVVQSLTSTDSTHSNAQGSGWMVFISIMAESLLASGCWLTVQIICDRHQKTILEPNPDYEELQEKIDAWCKRRNENHRLAGQLAGKLKALSDGRQLFIEDNMGHFHAALKLAANNDSLKDFLS
jgi:hypothetical protein